ncbi:probable G-protein coupled receptor 139 [Stegostoma tigrinum]|uniref:probable G-protein coupled receptor 139 n=1 Tax=Stegostoma tigrinum TaxID=3053191 RepID=UPI0028708269|nr:probable G-protein coupled receptor 139 [Stegostoma tigrinum]XP_059499995.1 probable G-protein coupled receptor 139 [Stegostoma tigrinum]
MSLGFLIKLKILWAITALQKIYYPVLATFSVLVNVIAIVVLVRGKCGLSKCVTHFLVAMAGADLLVIIFDLILRQIPIAYREDFFFLNFVSLCNIHAVMLYAATDCSVWFTVMFTFDRFVAICCQKLRSKHCTKKTACVVLGTVTVLSCLKNIFWCFLYSSSYWLSNTPWFCSVMYAVITSIAWTIVELMHYIITPFIPFVLILVLNALTVKNIILANRARRRLLGQSTGDSPSDPEMGSRRKSMILLFVISGNFITLWMVFIAYSVLKRFDYLGYPVPLPTFVNEIGFMLQLLSCATNTFIYAVTQRKFREELKNGVMYPFIKLVKIIC